MLLLEYLFAFGGSHFRNRMNDHFIMIKHIVFFSGTWTREKYASCLKCLFIYLILFWSVLSSCIWLIDLFETRISLLGLNLGFIVQASHNEMRAPNYVHCRIRLKRRSWGKRGATKFHNILCWTIETSTVLLKLISLDWELDLSHILNLELVRKDVTWRLFWSLFLNCWRWILEIVTVI